MDAARPHQRVAQLGHRLQVGVEFPHHALLGRGGVDVAPRVGVERGHHVGAGGGGAHPAQRAGLEPQVHDAPAVRVRHVEVRGARAVRAPRGDRHRSRELADPVPERSQRRDRARAGLAQGVGRHPVAAGVGDVEHVVPGDERRAAVRVGHVEGAVQALDRVERGQGEAVELGVHLVHHHAIVVGVGHVEPVALVHRQPARAGERPQGVALAVEGLQPLAQLAAHQAVPVGIRDDLELARLEVGEAVVDVHVRDRDRGVRMREHVASQARARRAPGQGVEPQRGRDRGRHEGAGARGLRRGEGEDEDQQQARSHGMLLSGRLATTGSGNPVRSRECSRSSCCC